LCDLISFAYSKFFLFFPLNVNIERLERVVVEFPTNIPWSISGGNVFDGMKVSNGLQIATTTAMSQNDCHVIRGYHQKVRLCQTEYPRAFHGELSKFVWPRCEKPDRQKWMRKLLRAALLIIPEAHGVKCLAKHKSLRSFLPSLALSFSYCHDGILESDGSMIHLIVSQTNRVNRNQNVSIFELRIFIRRLRRLREWSPSIFSKKQAQHSSGKTTSDDRDDGNWRIILSPSKL